MVRTRRDCAIGRHRTNKRGYLEGKVGRRAGGISISAVAAAAAAAVNDK